MIGHWELATEKLMSHASRAWLTKVSRFLAMKSDFSQMHRSRSRLDCEQIWADWIDRIFDHKHNQCTQEPTNCSNQ